MNAAPAVEPLVSCLMPTANRARFVPQAVACFLAQDFAGRELVVLDNGTQAIEHLLPADPRIRYHRAPATLKLGELRNRACELARGDILVHWDDDDWYPSDRISRQVERLRKGAELCATSRVYFLASDGARAWEFHSGGARPWLAGSSFAYTRAAWQRRAFEPIRVGEDSRFAASVPRERIADLADPGLVIATVHETNTSPKRPAGAAWRVADTRRVVALKAGTTASAAITTTRAASRRIASPSRRIVVGVYADNDPGRLDTTLRFLAQNTDEAHETLVLDNGTNPQSMGAAAAFNQLLREKDADLHVFLESGSLVGPHWLSILCAALDANAAHGVAGPTTNMAWSVQGEFRNRSATEGNVALLAREAAARHGGAWQSLAPLYCLGDFCFAVKRAVVDAIGGADTDYGVGPCWEMDYAIRAARASFGVVWAKGAYVFRHPFTGRRDADERALLGPSKARYQRKFCGQLLEGARAEIAEHCRGEACPHFAPAAQLTLRIPLGAGPLQLAPLAGSCGTSGPLVSCIMPTHGRAEWVQQAILYFQRQTYGPRELIIVDDSPAPIESSLPCEPRIRYVHRKQRMTIGAKRNLACEMARGEVIAHWDDDDWYGRERLAAQVAPIAEGSADVTAFRSTPFLDLARGESWSCSPALFARLFAYSIHGGTLVYAKRLFGASRFPNVSIAEDAAFLRSVVSRGARLQPVDAGEHFVYVRHGRNAWRFACGLAVDATGWHRLGDLAQLHDDLPFYRARGLPVWRTA
jgi:glycosyltransferase involved in cell wall biosynthesis